MTFLRDLPSIDALIVLGSGLAGCFAADELHHVAELDATVDGHPGRLALLELADGRRALVALGRRHLYEGISVAEAQAVVRMAALAGARDLVLTNAAGGLRPDMRVGGIMLITDVIASLLGASSAALGREPIVFATLLHDAVERGTMERGVRLERGVYVGVLGPSYETRAEVRMLRKMGADAVGMSTVAEAAAACELGMRVLGLSLITNVHSETPSARLDHAHVVEEGRAAVPAMRAAIDAALEALAVGADNDVSREPSGSGARGEGMRGGGMREVATIDAITGASDPGASDSVESVSGTSAADGRASGR